LWSDITPSLVNALEAIEKNFGIKWHTLDLRRRGYGSDATKTEVTALIGSHDAANKFWAADGMQALLPIVSDQFRLEIIYSDGTIPRISIVNEDEGEADTHDDKFTPAPLSTENPCRLKVIVVASCSKPLGLILVRNKKSLH